MDVLLRSALRSLSGELRTILSRHHRMNAPPRTLAVEARSRRPPPKTALYDCLQPGGKWTCFPSLLESVEQRAAHMSRHPRTNAPPPPLAVEAHSFRPPPKAALLQLPSAWWAVHLLLRAKRASSVEQRATSRHHLVDIMTPTTSELSTEEA